MTRKQKVILGVGCLAAVLVAALLAVPAVQRSFFYPKPHGLPPAVPQATDQLLKTLQTVLEANAPAVAKALQPGLPESQIAALEAQGGFHLSDDLRMFYHWHNG